MVRKPGKYELKVIFHNPNTHEQTIKMLIDFYAWLVYDAIRREDAEKAANTQKETT